MNSYKYSILKYNHSKLIDESINIGILFFDFSVNKIEFLYPDSLSRISGLYDNLSILELRRYLKLFAEQTKRVQKTLEKDSLKFYTEFDTIIKENYLVTDSNSLVFSEIKEGVASNIIALKKYIFNQYFSFYAKEKSFIRKDEEYLERLFVSKLKSKLIPDFTSVIRNNVKIENDKVSCEFDYAWKNGSLNLVTPVSFDYKDQNPIRDKSLKWYATLDLLSEKANKENLSFDLIISKPSDRNLFRYFDKSLKKIIDINVKKKLVFEDENLDNYVSEAAKYLNKVNH